MSQYERLFPSLPSGLKTKPEKRKPRPKIPSMCTQGKHRKYSDESVAYIKWLLRYFGISTIASMYHVSNDWVKSVGQGTLRLHVKPLHFGD